MLSYDKNMYYGFVFYFLTVIIFSIGNVLVIIIINKYKIDLMTIIIITGIIYSIGIVFLILSLIYLKKGGNK